MNFTDANSCYSLPSPLGEEEVAKMSNVDRRQILREYVYPLELVVNLMVTDIGSAYRQLQLHSRILRHDEKRFDSLARRGKRNDPSLLYDHAETWGKCKWLVQGCIWYLFPLSLYSSLSAMTCTVAHL